MHHISSSRIHLMVNDNASYLYNAQQLKNSLKKEKQPHVYCVIYLICIGNTPVDIHDRCYFLYFTGQETQPQRSYIPVRRKHSLWLDQNLSPGLPNPFPLPWPVVVGNVRNTKDDGLSYDGLLSSSGKDYGCYASYLRQ